MCKEKPPHDSEIFEDSTEGRTHCLHPSRQINNDTYNVTLESDHVYLIATDGFQVEVRVCDPADGLTADRLLGVVIGFPMHGDDPKMPANDSQRNDIESSTIESKGRFSVGDSVTFCEKKVQHILFRNKAHYRKT